MINNLIVVRDPDGKPKLATVVRWLTLPRSGIKLAVTLVNGYWYTVTEPQTGAAVSSSFDESFAIEMAKERLKRHGIKSFRAGVKKTLDEYGTLPSVESLQESPK